MFKRILSVVLLAFVFATSTNAQSWKHFVTEADELTGEKGHESDTYTDETGNAFVIWSDEGENFRVISSSSIFDFVGEYRTVTAIIGYYDMNNKLIEKNEIQLIATEGQASQAEPNMVPMIRPLSNKKRVKMLLDFVRNKQGYVRILAPLYGTNGKFDIKIPCLKNPKPTE